MMCPRCCRRSISKVAIFGLLVGHLCRDTFRGELESRACPWMDRHADNVGRRHAGGAAKTI